MPKKRPAATQVNIRSVRGLGVLVTGASAGEIRKGLTALRKKRQYGETARLRVAEKWLGLTERFVRSGGRFKRRYKRKKKT